MKTFEYSVRVKSQLPATYQQSQALLSSDNVKIEGVGPAAANARITKNMPFFDAEEALEAVQRDEEVVIRFN